MVDIVTLVVLRELMDSDDKKPHRGKTGKWVKRRRKRKEKDIEKCSEWM